MAGATTNLGLPYPELTDAADISAAVQPLADKIESDLIHVADVKMTAASSAPSGWLLCDGAAVSRSTYAHLFSAIGTTFGAGNGTTTFNVPDFKGRSPLGAGTGSGLAARTRGTKLGTEPVNMPTHTHALASGGGVMSDAGGTYTASGTDVVGIQLTTIANATNPGGDNMQPNLVVNFVIKT